MPTRQNQEGKEQDYSDLARGLPMFTASDAQALAEEKQQLTALQSKPLPGRWRGYLSLSGPGWMQSAMTLGSGSAMASLFAGAFLQYKLLWVQPVAMLLGIVMLSAMSHQTLCTGIRPFDAMKRFIHPSVAWMWGIAALATTVVWHFPQYALAAGMSEDIIKAVTGWQPQGYQQMLLLVLLGIIFLILSTAICWNYAKGHRGIRIYEKVLKGMVWMIIVAFLVVVIRRAVAGGVEWGKVARGYLTFSIPTDPRGISVMIGAFAAAVGLNMTFLFPYTLLARGWGREHRGLARFDLMSGMLVPYVLATSLMVIATGCTIYDPQRFATGGTMLSPTLAASMLESAGLSVFFSRVVFGLGILGMALSTITLQMLVCGFAACEVFGVEPGGRWYKLGCLIPAPGVLGVVLWKYMGPWIAVPASAICGVALPIAYIAFFLLNNSKKFLQSDRPVGGKGIAWNAVMLTAIVFSIAAACYYLYSFF
ncbi:MAG TPA: divalent metal cation transporter [Sedimentisphaerales bacterium]|nr:divalent metal cation transporter [Sedimentisphaerales bacterium]